MKGGVVFPGTIESDEEIIVSDSQQNQDGVDFVIYKTPRSSSSSLSTMESDKQLKQQPADNVDIIQQLHNNFEELVGVTEGAVEKHKQVLHDTQGVIQELVDATQGVIDEDPQALDAKLCIPMTIESDLEDKISHGADDAIKVIRIPSFSSDTRLSAEENDSQDIKLQYDRDHIKELRSSNHRLEELIMANQRFTDENQDHIDELANANDRWSNEYQQLLGTTHCITTFNCYDMSEELSSRIEELTSRMVDLTSRVVDTERQLIELNMQKPFIGEVTWEGTKYQAAIFPSNGEVWSAVIMDTEPAMLNNVTGKHIQFARTIVPKRQLSRWNLLMGQFFGYTNAYNGISTTD